MQLLIIGLVLGLGAKEDINWWGMATDAEHSDSALHKSINGLAKLDAHLMLHIFLPPLIFESAASLEWHLFDKAKTYIAMLAGPGILLATFLTAQVLNLLHKDQAGRKDGQRNLEKYQMALTFWTPHVSSRAPPPSSSLPPTPIPCHPI